jgi:hypothetical protein
MAIDRRSGPQPPEDLELTRRQKIILGAIAVPTIVAAAFGVNARFDDDRVMNPDQGNPAGVEAPSEQTTLPPDDAVVPGHEPPAQKEG